MLRLARALQWMLTAIGFAFVVVTVTPIDGYLIGKLAGPWKDPKGDILIVPGAESMNDAMGPSSFMRSIYAVRAWKEGGFRQLLLTGGSRNGGPPIAEQMRDYVVSQGIPPSAILLEEQSQSTHENALFTTRLLAGVPGRKVLLTSDYHMFRASRAFRKAGLDFQPRPFLDNAKGADNWLMRWPIFLGLCKEIAKCAYYEVRGWV
jgi:uncharacterized SAM-binding protein YcdF (DUF218 family)